MKKISYVCPLCKKSGITHYDDDCPDEFVLKLKDLIHCNRCANWKEDKSRLLGMLGKACSGVAVIRRGIAKSEESEAKQQQLLSKAKESIDIITKKLAKVACEYYRITNIWDKQFADMLFDNPDRWPKLVGVYLSGLRDLSLDDSNHE